MKKIPYCLQHPKRPVHARGRCKSCYMSIKRMIRNGKMTEAEAVRDGYLLSVPRVRKVGVGRREG